MKTTIKVLVEGGKATPGPPLGPALGPLGVSVRQVVDEINKRTADFSGLRVPVNVIVDGETKRFEIEVGLPPTSALVKKELGLEKGARSPGKEVVGDLTLDQVIKIAKVKLGLTLAKDLKSAVKEVLGACISTGVTVHGKDPREVQREIDEGKHVVG